MPFLMLVVGVALPIGGAIVADSILRRMGQMSRETLKRSTHARTRPLLAGAIANGVLVGLWWASVAVDRHVTDEKMLYGLLFAAQSLVVLWSMVAGIRLAMKKDSGTPVVAGVAVGTALILPIVGALAAIWVYKLGAFFQDY